jgi:DNA-binding response OmpR family regulator
MAWRVVILGSGEGLALQSSQCEVVARCAEPGALLEQLGREWPDAVLVVEQEAPALAAVLGELRAAQVPVVVVTGNAAPTSTLRWLRLGASDVRTPLTATSDLDRVPSPSAPLIERARAWAARERLTGEFRVLPNTPLEGVAVFVDGRLERASFCGLEADSALAEMLAMEDTEPAFSRTPEPPPPSKPQYAPRVLVVEDDPDIRALLTKLIARDGYRVLEAADGLEGFDLIRREPLDLVVADLDMPRLDGWGLLRLLRDELTTRELPVVLLSAHDDAVATLKAARAGARAYLKKTGRSRDLLDALALLTAPRQRAWSSLSSRRETSVEVAALGPAWVLGTLAELDVRGRLELEDALGRYEVTLCNGRLLDAVAQTGSLRVTGTTALEAVLCSTGRGRFVFTEVSPREDAPWLFEVLQHVNRQLALAAAQRAREASSAPGRLRVDGELALLYSRVASPRELKLLDGLNRRPASLDELATLTGLPADDVTRMLTEFLRRGVVAEHR